MQKQLYARLRKARRAKNSGNKQCADCRTSNATWTSYSLGVFLCMHCAGVHRSLGTHLSKVKSSTTDSWTESDVRTMESVGNKTANSYWEATLDANDRERVNEFSSPSARESFIKRKYVERAWVASDSGGIPYLLKEEASPPRGVKGGSDSTSRSTNSRGRNDNGITRKRGGNPSPWVSASASSQTTTTSTSTKPSTEPAERPRRRRRRAQQKVEETNSEPPVQPEPQPQPPTQPTQPSSLFSGMSFNDSPTPAVSNHQTQPPTQPVQPVVAQPAKTSASNLLDFNVLEKPEEKKRQEAARLLAEKEAAARQAEDDLSELMQLSAATAPQPMAGFVQPGIVNPAMYQAANQFGAAPIVLNPQVQQMVQLPDGRIVPLQSLIQQQTQLQPVTQVTPTAASQRAYGTSMSPPMIPMVAPNGNFSSPPQSAGVIPPLQQFQSPPNPLTSQTSPSSSVTSQASSAFGFVNSPPTGQPGQPSMPGVAPAFGIPGMPIQQTQPPGGVNYADPFANMNVPSATDDSKVNDSMMMNGGSTSIEEKSDEFRTITKPGEVQQSYVAEDKTEANDLFGKLFHEHTAAIIEKSYKIGDVVIRRGEYATILGIDYQTNPPTCVVKMHKTQNMVNTEFDYIRKAPDDMQPKTGEVGVVSAGVSVPEAEPTAVEEPEPVDASTSAMSIPDAFAFTGISRPQTNPFMMEEEQQPEQVVDTPSETTSTGFGFATGAPSESATSTAFGFATSAQPPAQQPQAIPQQPVQPTGAMMQPQMPTQPMQQAPQFAGFVQPQPPAQPQMSFQQPTQIHPTNPFGMGQPGVAAPHQAMPGMRMTQPTTQTAFQPAMQQPVVFQQPAAQVSTIPQPTQQTQSAFGFASTVPTQSQSTAAPAASAFGFINP